MTKTKKAPAEKTETLDPVEESRRLASVALAAAEFRHRVDQYGRPVTPAPEWLESLEAWLTAYNPVEFPLPYKQMRHLDRTLQLVQAQTLTESPYAENGQGWLELWRAFDEAIEATFRKPPTVPPRATPAQMAKSFIRDGQVEPAGLRAIANEWRWFTENNQGDTVPDVWRVQREIASPGSELTPEAIREREHFDRVQLGLELSEAELAELSALERNA